MNDCTTLPATGASAMWIVILATTAVVTGALLVAGGRRRGTTLAVVAFLIAGFSVGSRDVDASGCPPVTSQAPATPPAATDPPDQPPTTSVAPATAPTITSTPPTAPAPTTSSPTTPSSTAPAISSTTPTSSAPPTSSTEPELRPPNPQDDFISVAPSGQMSLNVRDNDDNGNPFAVFKVNASPVTSTLVFGPPQLPLGTLTIEPDGAVTFVSNGSIGSTTWAYSLENPLGDYVGVINITVTTP